jgi:hypothetical protein
LNTLADGNTLRDDLSPELPIMVEVIEQLNPAATVVWPARRTE